MILIRHGESVANAERRFTTGTYEPLSGRGREEARATSRFLLERFDPVALYSSPFVRALETARLIGSVLGLEPLVVQALREQDFGLWGGQPYERLEREAETGEFDRWRFRPPRGETLLEVAARVGPALDGIAHRHRGHEVIVVSHGGVMAAVRARTQGDRAFAAPPVLTANAEGYVIELQSEVGAASDAGTARYAGPVEFRAAPLRGASGGAGGFGRGHP